MTDVHRFFLVPAAYADAARNMAGTFPGGLDNSGNPAMFITPAYDGETIAAYTSSGHISGTLAGFIPWDEYQDGVLVESHPGNLPALVAALNVTNPELNATVEQIQPIFDASEITNEPVFVALERLGLTESPSL